MIWQTFKKIRIFFISIAMISGFYFLEWKIKKMKSELEATLFIGLLFSI
jgi:hypothetical protein